MRPRPRHRIRAGATRASALVIGSALGWLAISPLGGPTPTASAATPVSASAARAMAAAQAIGVNEVSPPSRRGGAWVAKIMLPTMVRRRPGGERRVWRARTATRFNRQAQHLLVLRARRAADGGEWLRVRLPIRPNSAAGWIPRDRVLLSRTRYSITVNVGRRQVRVHKARKAQGRAALVRKSRAVVGKPKTPTPKGLFAIYETVRQPNPNAFLGNWALHLTAHSNVLFDFGGGDGRVAIHGRGGESLATPLGTAASNGCIRMPNRFMSWLRKRARAGTPVRVVRG
jgi:lipoprotein-anchoring transpeptidase ErfK/SrfK